MRGVAIPSWSGNSIPCVAGSHQRQSPTRRTSLSRSWSRGCRDACSSALRTWTTFMSRQGRFASSTCTASFSKAAAIDAHNHHFTTLPPTILHASFPGVSAADGFARTSAGLAKCRSRWIEAMGRWSDVRSFDLHGCWHIRRGRASREFRCTRGWSCANDLRRSRRTRKRIRVHRMPSGESWGGVTETTGCILFVSYCNLAYSAFACFRMGMSGSASFQRVRKS
jgi:hypothetical protein